MLQNLRLHRQRRPRGNLTMLKLGDSLHVSVIIPFQKYNPYVVETLSHLSKVKLELPKVAANTPARIGDNIGDNDAVATPAFSPLIRLTVVLLPDEPLAAAELAEVRTYPLTTEVIATGKVSPAIKRDQGAEKIESDIIAFIDDDAYPAPDWLTEAVMHFKDPQVVAVGGPQITPPADSFWQKVSGASFLSPLNGASMKCRYWPVEEANRDVDDWPSVNLLVERQAFLEVGGFDSSYWPGEDTKLCLDLTTKLKKKIIYEPRSKVFHHRRAGLKRHLKQIGNYGLHRGFFAKTLPDTSRRPIYFVPSLFVIFLAKLILFFAFESFWIQLAQSLGVSRIVDIARVLFVSGLAAYLAALTYSALSIGKLISNLAIGIATTPYLFFTHLWYGLRFLKGFFLVKTLQSKLGR